jgi:hypothetical protein
MAIDPNNLQIQQEQNFTNFEEEVEHIQEVVASQEATQEVPPTPETRESAIAKEVEQYKDRPASEVLHPDFQMQVDEIEAELGDLSPEHDKQIDELATIMASKGIKNTLAILERLGNFHVSDDFHRFLVQYIAKGLEVKGLKAGTPMFKALNMRLFEVTLPEMSGEKGAFSELVRAMEQFYIGMMSLQEGGKVKNHFTIELALSNYSSDLVFYAAVPKVRAQLFEQQLLAAFPRASILERKEDYNPFNAEGRTVASIAELSDHKAFPIKTYEEFDQDPLNVILGTFSKINKNGEGAAIQLSIAPSGNDVNQDFKDAAERLKDGEVLSRAFEGTGKRVTREIFSLVGDVFSTATSSNKQEADDEKLPEVNAEAVEKVQAKMQSPILRTNVRIVASSGTQTRAEQILAQLESAFHQFGKQQSNDFVFKRREGARLKELLHNFTFRLFNDKEELLLNTKELTTMMHFPVTQLSSEVKSANLRTAPAPVGMDEKGVLLGINNHRGTETEVRMTKEDRVRHFYVIGQTGTGKTVFLKNMAIQDIQNGNGVCFMDPHGTDIEEILANVPKERMEDVIYFDPSDMDRPMGLNMLECDHTDPQQKSFVINELLSIFNKLFDMKVAGGPMFEQYFRNATGLVIEDPSSGSTLIEIVRVLADEDFRKLKLSNCNNQIVKQFWEEIAGKAGGDASLQNMVPYITNKFDVFLSNDIMRMMMAQEKSAFNMREVMDERKILLVNLAKGRLGDINSHLIGLILVGKILMAALSRVDAHGKELQDFYLYIDEFQNVTTDSISAILSEARKYRLSLNVAHQYLDQLPEDIKGAIFGNVGSKAVFRISSEDAQFMEASFAPTFEAADIMKTPNLNAYISMLVDGYPAKPFNAAIPFPPRGDAAHAEAIKQLSKQKYGQDRTELEKMVAEKFASMKKSDAPAAGAAKPSAAAGGGRKLTPEEKQFILKLRKQKQMQAAAAVAGGSAAQSQATPVQSATKQTAASVQPGGVHVAPPPHAQPAPAPAPAQPQAPAQPIASALPVTPPPQVTPAETVTAPAPAEPATPRTTTPPPGQTVYTGTSPHTNTPADPLQTPTVPPQQQAAPVAPAPVPEPVPAAPQTVPQAAPIARPAPAPVPEVAIPSYGAEETTSQAVPAAQKTTPLSTPNPTTPTLETSAPATPAQGSDVPPVQQAAAPAPAVDGPAPEQAAAPAAADPYREPIE